MLHLSSGPCAVHVPGSALAAFLVSVAPLGAAPPSTTPPPPWAVESPAAAGARFGLGLDYLFEHQESLRIRSQRSVVSLPAANGGIQTHVVDGDPDLLNRKFDFEWELKGPGVSVPLALSSFRLTDLIEVFPTLTLEAASVDVTLDSISKTELNPKATLQGHGSLFGAKLGVTASLCGDCPWFNGTTYHYRSLPAFEADRSPAFSEPGFEVLHDEVRLSQEVHEVSTKFGYIAPNKRVAYYTGVRTRWTDVEIEDELRLRSLGYGQQTRLASRTRLNSETIQAVAGVDAHLGGSIFARTETSISGQDYGVQVKIVHLGRWRDEKKRAAEITSIVTPRLERILADFVLGSNELPFTLEAGVKMYQFEPVIELLEKTKSALLKALDAPELIAMRDHVEFLFSGTQASLALRPQSDSRRRLASLDYGAKLDLLQDNQGSSSKQTAFDWEKIRDGISTILDIFRTNQVVVDLCIKSSPPKATFFMHPVSFKPDKDEGENRIRTDSPLENIYRGRYLYKVSLPGFKDSTDEDALDLVASYGPIIDCQLEESSKAGRSICTPRPGAAKRECRR